MNTTTSETSATVFKAIKILNFLSEASGPQSVITISKQLNLSNAVVHRNLTTLKIEGLVFQDPQSKLYSLGMKILEYANRILTDLPFAAVIEPWLLKLRNLTGETVGFYVQEGNTRVCALEYVSRQEIKRAVGVGKRLPLHIGASGRAILAFQDEDIQHKILIGLDSEQKKEVIKKLAITKDNGYAMNEEEITPEVGALSAPVYGSNNNIIGALSISGPMFRWNKKSMQTFIPALLNATDEIKKTLES
ncbi:IclR family transcriptional regulator [Scopulibacillus darangshiensis]|uniref:IclR family transcriptional regulator n=1 Tax=Scopulibacillus darangshiensis TaxID=442528 RepID=A0A4R2NZY8_9BACL|nr:IclR family transcriptional regulator [Scopulibacillus darangshiensis]TCP27812.1 IclR family transcriptional regulator [Scopulibacillus darangshiensis]